MSSISPLAGGSGPPRPMPIPDTQCLWENGKAAQTFIRSGSQGGDMTILVKPGDIQPLTICPLGDWTVLRTILQSSVVALLFPAAWFIDFFSILLGLYFEYDLPLCSLSLMWQAICCTYMGKGHGVLFSSCLGKTMQFGRLNKSLVFMKVVPRE